ncbi:hypothetical protein [Ornithinicoccus hortensis]|nr:hypothetical protein [Ornithinicoccus hortensis]
MAPTARREAEDLAGQRPAGPARWPHTDVALLQRSAGNRATVRHLRRLPRVLVSLQRTPETDAFRADPTPRTSSSPDHLLLWNYPVDEAAMHPQHQAQVATFLDRAGTAWLHAGTSVRVVGWASPSGSAAHNAILSAERASVAASVVRRLRPGRRVDPRGAGIGSPQRSPDPMVQMAMDRSVEIEIVLPRRAEIPDVERHRRQATAYLKAQVGGVVGGSFDQIWTPTATGIVYLMPRNPLDLGAPDHYGSHVPDGPTTARPASTVMPGHQGTTYLTLAGMLDSAFRRNGVLTPAIVRQTVDRFLAEARAARARMQQRLLQLQVQTSQGGGSMVADGLRRFRAFEMTGLAGDPSCVWRYLDD